MFRREVHRRALAVLEALDGELLTRTAALFAGGTRLVLDLDEYRESADLDFLCADTSGYAELRILARRDGPAALFAAGDASLGFPREARADQLRHPLYAEKLLANSDRWPDRSVLSRDLIDLGMLRARAGAIPPTAWLKAEGAYRGAVRDDLGKALRWFLDHEDHRERCFTGLGVVHPAVILRGIEELLAELENRAPE